MMRDMTNVEMDALAGLLDGDLQPFASLLAERNDALHPIVQRELYRQICGSVDETDWRLRVEKHPSLKSIKQGSRAQLRSQGKRVQTAMIMVKHGALKKGGVDAALLDTMKETGQDRATVMRHWSAEKGFMQFCARRGYLLP